MKEMIIILRPKGYYKTKEALTDARFFAMSTKEVLGRGKKPVKYITPAGGDVPEEVYKNSLVSKKLIEMVVRDEQVQEVIDIVLSVNSHNQDGDGKIFVLPVEEAVRIHTKEKGLEALV